MRKLLVPALAVALTTTSVLAQTPPRVRTRDFVQAASESDRFETIEATVVAAQSRNPDVLGFARQMTQDHARTSAALMQAARHSGLPPPDPGLSGDQQKLLSALQSQKGPEFDKLYAKQQVLAHAQALVVAQKYAASGPDADLRGAAQAAVPIVRRHLEMAQRLRSQVGGS